MQHGRFHRSLRQRRARAAAPHVPGFLQGAARHPGRHREHQLLSHHRTGRVGTDAVRAPDGRATALLPVPDEAPGAGRHSRARPAGRDAQRRHPAERVRQAGLHRQPPARQERAGAPARALCRRGRDAGAHAPGRTRLRSPAAQSAQPALVERDRAHGHPAHRRPHGRPAALRAGLPEPCGRLARLCGAATRPRARRPVPRQRDVRWRAPDRLLRLLLRRRGQLAVRPGRVPQRLVHRTRHRRP